MTEEIRSEVILLDKPLGWTSFQALKKIKYAGKFKKIGHAGTLDPLATGLLILCTGKKTKEIDIYQGQIKEYEGVFSLGATRPSADMETEIDEVFETSHITADTLEAARKTFLGEIEQYPPVHSAVKIDGKRAYEYARKGTEVQMRPRLITISEFDINDSQFPDIAFRVVCTKGTYIRSLAVDFGKAVGSGAYLKALRRTKIGDFKVEDAYSIEAFVEKEHANIQRS